MSVRAIANGRYEIVSELGHGGMAIVYLAQDRELARPVAVKLLAENIAGDRSFRRRFVREARLAARLSHPNVVHVYDVGEESGVPYIVTEYVPGETVAELLSRRRKLPATDATAIVRQAALGLQHAHEAGLVHRDVKPQNLLLREDGVLKVADFGIARAAELSRVTEVGTVLGTAGYLAPEQLAGAEVTPATDVYALGAVLYELLTGRTPHEFASLVELAEQQTSGSIMPVREREPSVPEELERLVMRCLARDPQFRPASAAEVAATLAEPQTEEIPAHAAPTVALPPRRSRPLAGGGAWIWIAAAVAIGAVALALGLARIGGKGGTPSSRPVTVLPAVQSIPRGQKPAADARNLARWLREHSR